MFSFLDMINSSLSYFNIKPTLKNKIYVVIATLGDGYLIYVTWRLFANQVWVRALLYCLAVLFLTYYLYLNAVYYFLNRTSKLDFLSPWLSKVTGTAPSPETGKLPRRRMMQPLNQAAGYYEGHDVVKAQVETDAVERQNLQHLVDSLVADKLLLAEYDGMNEAEILAQYRATKEPVTALNHGQTLPYYELVHEPSQHRLEIYAGRNEMEKVKVGHITKIGLTDAHEARMQYQLYLAKLFITGGPNKIAGRRDSTILTDGDFGLDAYLAYRDRSSSK
ncbi:DUF6681 family protein [Lactobacillus sp. 3B(2020)]|uniref:DUF6681 family protein n=1 Tax=Lactobacillus sp. 3B(2020) TaxID=2695882 RepID=UPI0015DE4730|nr:DUF6681 family protein [Lactobacillus sp. 3B(2020)]QLL69251.1 hypothetical protein GTO83_01020 [Lactobacillus sp. 3B(2020)]